MKFTIPGKTGVAARREASAILCILAPVLTFLLGFSTGRWGFFALASGVALLYAYREHRIGATDVAPVVPAYVDQPLTDYQAIEAERRLARMVRDALEGVVADE